MSPHIALHDPVFRDYLWIVLISLAIAGAVLGFLQFVLKKETASMFKTYCSWILIAGIGFIVLFLGRIPTIVGVTLLAIYAFKEFARASGLYRDSWMTGAVYAGIVTVGIASLISPPRGEEQGTGWYGFFVAVPAFAIALILLIPILRNRARSELRRAYRSPLSVLFTSAGCSVTSDLSLMLAMPTASFVTLFLRRG
jgi:phosphatidate cytidylyltransferase